MQKTIPTPQHLYVYTHPFHTNKKQRLSFVTEEVANHTNQTIGALLNATFGNAPELLISSAALSVGYYRVVQLTLLGSMLTNLLFVFGLSCLIGGIRYQTQSIRIVSGNVSVGMLMISVAGLGLPAALVLSDEMVMNKEEQRQYVDKNGDGVSDIVDGPTVQLLGFSRFNAVIMVLGYIMYLVFQLGSHVEEFEDNVVVDDDDDYDNNNHDDIEMRRTTTTQEQQQPNKFCGRLFRFKCAEDDDGETTTLSQSYQRIAQSASTNEIELQSHHHRQNGLTTIANNTNTISTNNNDKPSFPNNKEIGFDDTTVHTGNLSRKRIRGKKMEDNNTNNNNNAAISQPRMPPPQDAPTTSRSSSKSHCSDGEEEHNGAAAIMMPLSQVQEESEEVHITFQMGLLWLFIITISISAMSDILVDTIDGFTYKYVSAVIFAYRNEMDLCIGITVGSAVQIALFVLPGSVLIGWAMDRSMSLFFRGFETCCLIFSVVSIAAVLQGVGVYLLGVYFMIAAGFWFHELENLSIDGELESDKLHDQTSIMYPQFGSNH
eukprot:scaffold3165_cov62-Cyclotella_meneghiniana.AAC.9